MKKEYLFIVILLVYFLYIQEPKIEYITEVCNEGTIYVEIKGEINNQGVYEVAVGTRLIHVVELAGGFTNNADVFSVNLSQKLEDEDVIIVGKVEEKSHNYVNLNTATKDELMMLPSLGEKKALAIIEYREQYGPFQTIEDIKNVSGIGDSIFEAIKDMVSTK